MNKKKIRKFTAIVTALVCAIVMQVPQYAYGVSKNQYAVVATNDVHMSGSAKIQGDLAMKSGTFTYGKGGVPSVSGTAYIGDTVIKNNVNPQNSSGKVMFDELTGTFPSGNFEGKAIPKADYFKNSTSGYTDGKKSLYLDWQTPEYVLEDDAYFDSLYINNPYTFVVNTKKNNVTVIRVNTLNVGNSLKIKGEGKVVLYVDTLVRGSNGTINPTGDAGQLTIVFTGDNAELSNFKKINANSIAVNVKKVDVGNGDINGNIYASGKINISGSASITGLVYAPKSHTIIAGSGHIYGQLVTESLEMSGNTTVKMGETHKLPSDIADIVGNVADDNDIIETETTGKPAEEETTTGGGSNPDIGNKPDGSEETDKEESKEEVSVNVLVPRRMSIRLEDGTVLHNKSSFKMSVDTEIKFQMCSNNWDNDKYDDNGNGLAGTVVYKAVVSSKVKQNSYDAKSRTFIIAKSDKVLRTDTNKCFMAYRFYFKKGDYNKQTGIKNVVNTPLESLSVNLPLGSTITCDAYVAMEKIDGADVFIETAEDKTICYKDYIWQY